MSPGPVGARDGTGWGGGGPRPAPQRLRDRRPLQHPCPAEPSRAGPGAAPPRRRLGLAQAGGWMRGERLPCPPFPHRAARCASSGSSDGTGDRRGWVCQHRTTAALTPCCGLWLVSAVMTREDLRAGYIVAAMLLLKAASSPLK